LRALSPWFDSPWVPAVGLTGLLVVHIAGSGTGVPVDARLLGVLPGAAAFLIGWQYFRRGGYGRLPFLAYALLQFYAYWGLPAAYGVDGRVVKVGQEAYLLAMVGVCVTVGVVMAAYPIGVAVGTRLLRAPVAKIFPVHAGPGLKYVMLPWFAVCLVTSAGLPAALPPGLSHLAVSLGNGVPFLCCVALFPGALPRFLRPYGLVVCATALSAMGLLTGMTEAALRPLLVAGLLLVVVAKRVPWRWALVAALLMLVLQPAKTRYRATTASRGGSDGSALSVSRAVSDWIDALSETWSGTSDANAAFEQVGSRLNELTSIGRTMELVPGRVPHDDGAAWVTIPSLFVPRLLDPGKADMSEVYNDHYNLTFGLQSQRAVGSSTGAFPLVADGYWNFGWWGIVAASFVVGLMLGMFAGGVPLGTWGPLSLGVAALVETHANSNLAAQVGVVAQRTVGICAVCWAVWLASAGWRGSPGNHRW
jgi:hypothetical protein